MPSLAIPADMAELAAAVAKRLSEHPAKALYTVNNFCKAADMSRAMAYRLMSANLLRFVVVGSERKIPASELERIAAEGCPLIPKSGG